MKSYIIILGLFSIAFLVSIAMGCSQESPESVSSSESKESERKPLSDTELMEQYHRLIKELHLTTNIAGCENSNAKIILSEKEYDENWDAIVRTIWGPVDMIFDAYTGEVYRIRNSVIWEKFYGVRCKELAEPSEKMRAKTEAEIKSIAENILKKLSRQQTSEIVLRSIEFRTQEVGSFWETIWDRTHNGYRYEADITKVTYNEKYGLRSYVNYFISNPCSTEVKIPKEKAEKKAIAFAAKAMHFPLVDPGLVIQFNKWFKNWETGKIRSSKLIIVNPNYLFTTKSTAGTNKHNRNVRLAWVIAIEIGKREPNKKILYDKSITIWIDAATGEMLGGDFTL